MRSVLLASLLFAAPLLTGCLVDPTPPSASAAEGALPAMAAAWYEPALAREPGHDHRDLASHVGTSTPNFLLLGHDPLITRDASNRLVGSWGCGELGETEEGRKLAILDAFGRTAHVIADVTDSTRPFKVGEIVMSGVSAWDDTITPDGKYAIIGLNTLARVPSLQPGALGGVTPGALAPAARIGASFVDACTGEERVIGMPDIAATSGVMLFDLSDPSDPVFADYWPAPAFNMHSVSAAIVDGRTFITASTVQLVHSASYFEFIELVETPAGAKLVPLSAFAPPPVTVAQGHVFVPSQNGHNDVTIQKHPGDGKTYAYLAAWDGGMITLDFTVPQAPVMVATWAPPTTGLVSSALTDDCQSWGIHTTYPINELWEGKHYVIAGQECPFHPGTGTPAGQLFILDNTDPTDPTMVGRWNLPVDTGRWTSEYQASPHYVVVVGRTLFASMYHAGLWAIDLSGDLAAPPSIGVYMPTIPSGVNNPSFANPLTEQVNALANGDLVLYENASGIYVLRFDPLNPAPPALPAFR